MKRPPPRAVSLPFPPCGQACLCPSPSCPRAGTGHGPGSSRRCCPHLSDRLQQAGPGAAERGGRASSAGGAAAQGRVWLRIARRSRCGPGSRGAVLGASRGVRDPPQAHSEAPGAPAGRRDAVTAPELRRAGGCCSDWGPGSSLCPRRPPPAPPRLPPGVRCPGFGPGSGSDKLTGRPGQRPHFTGEGPRGVEVPRVTWAAMHAYLAHADLRPPTERISHLRPKRRPHRGDCPSPPASVKLRR